MAKRAAKPQHEPSSLPIKKARGTHVQKVGCDAAHASKLAAIRSQGVKRLQDVAANAERLWQEAVAARSPLVVEGELQDAQWQATKKWTNEYLKKAAGASKVLVEQKGGSSEDFGKGRKIHMTFGQLVQQLHSGNDSLYLTTQEAGTDADGQPQVMGPPVKELKADFPLRPECMGKLVPQQINLWMGAASKGASSGLHHDYHDNLYILLRGRKRFRLYPPSEAHHMYTHGHIKHVHPSGRIVYTGQPMVSGDGSDPREAKQWQQQQAAETELAAAEEATRAGKKGAKARLIKAEEALEAVLDAQLGFQQGGADQEDCSSNSSFPADIKDDYVDSGVDASSSDDDSMTSPVSQMAAATDQADAKRRKLDVRASSQRQAEDTDINWEAVVDHSHPPSFSQVDLSKSEKEIQMQYPRFPGPDRAFECELHAGQMLYLPCGWFHEVRSYGNSKEGGHLALNYWFHPPDNLDTTPKGMQTPYRSSYWTALWDGRCKGAGS